ncbi:MAG: L,D-transpeptidase family protein [Patescibacteria group bacterium]
MAAKKQINILSFGFIFFIALFVFSLVQIENAWAAELTDTDGDAYGDEQEIANGYSPFNAAGIKIEKSDVDQDGLSDYYELKFKTDPFNPDTDGDGYKDGLEIDRAHNPLSSSTLKLAHSIHIDLKTQKLTYLVSGEVWKEYLVSTGKASMPTPTGTYKIINKSTKAWSKAYQLWMPYWLGLDHGEFGIHELPLWPSGYREGENHLGKPVSHGCIRLGIGPAQYLFERVSVGTEVTIK